MHMHCLYLWQRMSRRFQLRRQQSSSSPLVGENLYRKVGEICNISGVPFLSLFLCLLDKLGYHSIHALWGKGGETLSNTKGKKGKKIKRRYTSNLETDGCNQEM